jgi:hypothetical protein
MAIKGAAVMGLNATWFSDFIRIWDSHTRKQDRSLQARIQAMRHFIHHCRRTFFSPKSVKKFYHIPSTSSNFLPVAESKRSTIFKQTTSTRFEISCFSVLYNQEKLRFNFIKSLIYHGGNIDSAVSKCQIWSWVNCGFYHSDPGWQRCVFLNNKVHF